MPSFRLQFVVLLALFTACKKIENQTSATSGADRQSGASVEVGMCDRIGGISNEAGACLCENGVAAFKLLGQSCAQMIARQTDDCNSRHGQILYDDGKCRCFPQYDILSSSSCGEHFPTIARTKSSLVESDQEGSSRGACVVLNKQTGKPHETCFEQVDLDGCAQSFEVAFNQTKPGAYDMMFFPENNCIAAKAKLN